MDAETERLYEEFDDLGGKATGVERGGKTDEGGCIARGNKTD